jgi:hypothetical protein
MVAPVFILAPFRYQKLQNFDTTSPKNGQNESDYQETNELRNRCSTAELLQQTRFWHIVKLPVTKKWGGDNTVDNRQNRCSRSVTRIGVNAAVKLQRFRHKFNLLSPVHEPLHP